ncbi:MAG: D-alanyl-D-alanine carboxypeptidase family protein [Verrucomicrobiota bacterium]
MKKYIFSALLVIASGTLLAADPPVITAKSAVLFDANTGRVILKKNEDEKRPVASTQKLLTAYIIANAGDLSNLVTIKEGDTNCEPTKLYVRTGQQYSRSQLLHGLLIHSGNDAARALARDNAGSVADFAARMNSTMRALGGYASNFMNPNGLPADGQYSSARDMARVARAAYRDPLLREIMRTRSYTFRYNSGKTTTWKNTNRVLRYYSFCNGMKTGYTEKAGHCLISSGSYNGKDVIAVVLGNNKSRIWNESANLLAFGLGISPGAMEKFHIPGAE